MKAIVLILLSLFTLSAFAQVPVSDDVELTLLSESDSDNRVKIQDVKQLISTIGAENTCMDEYLKRRKNLIIKLSLSPVTIVAGTYAATIGLGFAGSGIALLIAKDQLVGVVLGMSAGVLGGGTWTIGDTTLSVFQLVEIDRMVKTLAEQHLDRAGKNSAKIYAQYVKKNSAPLGETEFNSKLMELDANGKLCDGSFVKKPLIGSGRALRYKVARVKHLREQLH